MPSNKIIPAIVLSAHTSGLAVIRALGKHNIPVIVVSYEDHDMGIVSRYVKEVYRSPHPEQDEAGFMAIIKQIYDKYSKSVIIPADDATLMFLSKHKEFLSRWFIVSATDLRTTQLFIEKKYTYELCYKYGIPAPMNLVPENLSQVEAYAEKVKYPCLVKPSQGHKYYEIFRKKMETAYNKEELLFYYKQADEYGLEVMLQELIPGDSSGLNYNSLFINGEPAAEFISEKLRYSPDNFGVPCAAKTIELIPEVVESGRKILKAMNFEGFSCTEFKKDPRDNIYKLMEVNGRHNRSAALAVEAGLNFPLILYRYQVFCEIPKNTTYKKNVFWVDESRDLMSTFLKTLRLKYSFSKFIEPYIKDHVYAVTDGSDIRPILKRIADIIKMVFKTKKRKVEEVKVKGAF